MLKSEKNSNELNQIIADESTSASSAPISMDFDSSEEEMYNLEIMNLCPELNKEVEDVDLDIFIAGMERTMTKPRFRKPAILFAMTMMFSTAGLSMMNQGAESESRVKIPVPVLPVSELVTNDQTEVSNDINIAVVRSTVSNN